MGTELLTEEGKFLDESETFVCAKKISSLFVAAAVDLVHIDILQEHFDQFFKLTRPDFQADKSHINPVSIDNKRGLSDNYTII